MRDGATRGRGVGKCIQHNEIMDRAVVADRRDSHARGRELAGIGFAFVTQDVVLVDYDERIGQACELV